MPAEAAATPSSSVSALQQRIDELSVELRARTADRDEAMQRERALAEVLRVINSSPGNLDPVFDATLESATRLCDAAFGILWLCDQEHFHAAALHGVPERYAEIARVPVRPSSNNPLGRMLRGERAIVSLDAGDDELYRMGDPVRRALVDAGGARSFIQIALVKDDTLLGSLTVYRTEVRAFSEKQIALLKSFAEQAVIAIENARLLGELRQRTDELTESLEYQTATSEVLEVIGRSTSDVQPVLDKMLTAALRLSRSESGGIAVQQGDGFRYLAILGWNPEADKAFRSMQITPGRGTVAGRALAEGRVVQVEDVSSDPEFERPDMAKLSQWHTALGVPLMQDGRPIGAIAITRDRIEPFTERQIALVRTFADQAVIAIENARLLTEQREALNRQQATSEVLQVINSSLGQVEPVFDALLDKATSFCEAAFGILWTYDGKNYHAAAFREVPPAYAEYLRNPPPFTPEDVIGRIAEGESVVHIADAAAQIRQHIPLMRHAVALGGFRTILGVALRKEGTLLGAITIYRQEIRMFSDKQVALVQNFATQAVIAMENARLLEELTRRQQELSVTFEHMGDGVVMFDADLRIGAWNRNFQELLDMTDSFLTSRPSLDDYVRLLVGRGEVGDGNAEEEVVRYRERASHSWSTERTRPDGRTIEVRNNPIPGGGAVLIYGDITEHKKAEAEIAAARDAAEAALEQQTATAEILRAISRSPTDVQPVLDAVVKAAVRFCGATDAVIILREGDGAVFAAHEGPLIPAPGSSLPLNRETAPGRAILDGQTSHFPDIGSLDPVEFATAHRLAAAQGFRAAVSAPLLLKGIAIGSVALRKAEPGPFKPRQIELLETFAAQAVIAIQNVRLFTELRESLEQQTATAEILRAISQSPTDTGPVFAAIARNAHQLCDAVFCGVVRYDEEWLHIGALHGLSPEEERGVYSEYPVRAKDSSVLSARVVTSGCAQHIEDVLADGHYDPSHTSHGGRRRMFGVPMLRDGRPIGAIIVAWREPGTTPQAQIDLLTTFAAQAVIAIENVRLFTELRDSLERLKAAQANLIQAEKMASLGQLTAGIAHEIKNPLNFVNNFAGLSSELLDELKQAVDALLAEPDEDKRAELQDTMDLLTGNLAKIVEHGRRADGIVKSMLSHSRGGTGDWQESNINALVEEALNLAYHGARAQDKDFNVTLERDFARETKSIEVVPQDVTRVFLNLFGNGFYATRKRHLDGGDAGYRPTLRVSTRDLGEVVEVRVRDNGTGIQPEVRAKLFQPFFTTKPTGEGTGLGLSISYDIVTQQHGGTIEVESEPGFFTEFTVRLPRRRRAAQSRGAS